MSIKLSPHFEMALEMEIRDAEIKAFARGLKNGYKQCLKDHNLEEEEIDITK